MSDLSKYAHAVNAILSLRLLSLLSDHIPGFESNHSPHLRVICKFHTTCVNNMATLHATVDSLSQSAISAPIPQVPTSDVAPTKIVKPRMIQFHLYYYCFFPFRPKYLLHCLIFDKTSTCDLHLL